MSYTKEQEDTISFRDGNLQIIACAGSGKTDVITRRIANLVSKGIKTENIVAFTFTEKAAEEMKFRVRKHLQELRPEDPETGDMYIGTIHSFCFDLLKALKPKYKGYDVLEENTRMLFLNKYDSFYKIGLDNLDGKTYKVIEKFCRCADVVREEMINPDKLPSEFGQCYKNYIALLRLSVFPFDFINLL